MSQTLKLVFSALLLAAALTLAHALLRSATSHPPLRIDWIARTGAALVLYSGVFFSYAFLLRYFDLSTLYPLYTGLSIIGVLLIGTVYFGESLSLQKIIGTATIIAGVFLLSK